MTYKKLPVVLFIFNTSFFSSPSNHGSSLKKRFSSRPCCHVRGHRHPVGYATRDGCKYSKGWFNFQLKDLFQTYCLQWDLTPGGAGGTPGITIESVPAPGGNPVSPQGNIVVPNPTPTGWNIIPMGAGTFQFVFFGCLIITH